MPKIVKKIIRKPSPYKNKLVRESHVKANELEKKRYPKGYEKLKRSERKLNSNEFLGEHTSRGKVEISKKVPKPLRREVAYHERVEYKEEVKRGYYKRKKK